jgi:hypothetical protein
MMSVPLHDIIPSRSLWTSAARRRFDPLPKAQSSLRTPKASLRLLPEKCRGNHFSKLRASVFRAATAALSECGGSTPLCKRKREKGKAVSSDRTPKDGLSGRPAEAFHPYPMTAMILCKPHESADIRLPVPTRQTGVGREREEDGPDGAGPSRRCDRALEGRPPCRPSRRKDGPGGAGPSRRWEKVWRADLRVGRS